MTESAPNSCGLSPAGSAYFGNEHESSRAGAGDFGGEHDSHAHGRLRGGRRSDQAVAFGIFFGLQGRGDGRAVRLHPGELEVHVGW